MNVIFLPEFYYFLYNDESQAGSLFSFPLQLNKKYHLNVTFVTIIVYNLKHLCSYSNKISWK